MRLTFLADLRSPLARQWIRAFVDRGDDVQAISSYPVDAAILPGAKVSVVPLVFSGIQGGIANRRTDARRRNSPFRQMTRVLTPSRAAAARAMIGPLSVRFQRAALQALVDGHRTEIFHAMRIPYEGMAAAYVTGVPLVLSVWGNDFTLNARRTPLMAKATRRAVWTASAVHTDCYRDARLARAWGLPGTRPVWVLPGNGGLVESIFFPGPSSVRSQLRIPAHARIVINPRGLREYVRNDVFFASLHSVMEVLQDIHVICPEMASAPGIAEGLKSAAMADRIHLLPHVDAHQMADLFRAARVSVSLSTHDGTPNTLLEAMACGALPLVGDVESVREWIGHEVNGLVVPPHDPEAVSTALLRGLTDDALLARARQRNQLLVRERASFSSCIQQAAEHYEWLASTTPASRMRARSI